MLTAGTIVAGDFRIERALSEGGMGAVYVAEQISTGSMRALKVIRTELLHQQKLRQRFEQEAKVTSRIASDHVVSVVAAGIDPTLQLPWIAMELLQGQTLADVVHDRGPLPPAGALGILTQLAHAMDAAHRVGVVHRDLKPENIFLAESRRSGTPYFVKVLDFGIARVVREAQGGSTESLGTPLWMAPEQAGNGEAVGPKTDIWALGLIVFFLLTGKPYWLSAREDGTALSIVKEVCLNPLDKASVRAAELGTGITLTPAFDEWFSGCVTREQGARFATAGAAVASLRRALGMAEDDLGSGKTELQLPPTPGRTGVQADAKTELAIVAPTPAIPVSLAEPVTAPAIVAAASVTASPPNASDTPSGVVTKRSPGVDEGPKPKPRALWRAAVPAVIVLGLVTYLGIRSSGRASEDRSCAETHASEPCARSCARGNQESCATLGAGLAFPPIGEKQDVPQALTLLTHACESGHGCGTLGVLGEVGAPGAPADPDKVFERACEGGPLECAFGVAHVLRGPSGRELPEPWKQKAAALDLQTACKSSPDACGLSWLPKLGPATPAIRAAYETGCNAGSTLSCNNLATLYAEGQAGVEQNPELARARFQKACDAGDPVACNNIGFVAGGFVASPRVGPRGEIIYKLRCAGPFKVGCAAWGDSVRTSPPGTPQDLTTAAAAFERGCKMGAHVACVNLGALAYVGQGVPADRARAEQLFASTCFKGDPGACGEQASALLNIRMDHPRDSRGGFGFMQRACKGGEEDACGIVYTMMIGGVPDHGHEAEGLLGMKRLAEKQIYSHELAQLYETGADGLPRDPTMARKVAVSLCETEWHCSDAAYYYARGIGGPVDEGHALLSLTSGCDHDDLVSCTELGAAYRDGRLAGRDPTRAVSLFQKACSAGEWDGCESLSAAYATGDGAPKDFTRALSLARDACDRGNTGGCARVGNMLADGQGAPRDVDAAVPYLAFACRRAAMRACARLTELKKPVPDLDL